MEKQMNKASFLCKGFVALLVMMCTTTRLVWAEPVAEQQVEVQEAIEPLAILSKVDAKADAVVVIPSLRQLSDKVLILGKQLGVAQLPPDPLMMLKAMSGIMMGVDDQANVAVVVSKLDNALAQPFAAPNVAVLLPVTTVDQFMGNFEGRAQKLDNGLTEVMMPGSPVYVKSLGEKYVAMSDSQATLASYKAANADQWTQAQGTVATGYLSKGDLIVMFNPKTLATMLNDNMARIRTTMKVELDKQQEEDPALVAALEGRSAPFGLLGIEPATVKRVLGALHEVGLRGERGVKVMLAMSKLIWQAKEQGQDFEPGEDMRRWLRKEAKLNDEQLKRVLQLSRRLAYSVKQGERR